MRPLFSSLKKDRLGAFETDEGGPEKQLTFFPILLKFKKVLSGTRNVLMSTGIFVTVLK